MIRAFVQLSTDVRRLKVAPNRHVGAELLLPGSSISFIFTSSERLVLATRACDWSHGWSFRSQPNLTAEERAARNTNRLLYLCRKHRPSKLTIS